MHMHTYTRTRTRTRGLWSGNCDRQLLTRGHPVCVARAGVAAPSSRSRPWLRAALCRVRFATSRPSSLRCGRLRTRSSSRLVSAREGWPCEIAPPPSPPPPTRSLSPRPSSPTVVVASFTASFSGWPDHRSPPHPQLSPIVPVAPVTTLTTHSPSPSLFGGADSSLRSPAPSPPSHLPTFPPSTLAPPTSHRPTSTLHP
eukprot:4147070-Prymnesium_polylepis.1